MKKSKKLDKTLAQLKKELWGWFSKYVRLKGKGICFTCGRRCEGRNAHAGHFIKRSVCGLALFFNTDNVKLQCAYCNLWLDGNQYEFGIRLGAKKVKEIYELKKLKVVWGRLEYERLIEIFKEKVKKLEALKI